MQNKKIIEFQAGEKIEGFFLVKDVAVRIANNNKKYLDFTLSDNTGEINAKLGTTPGMIIYSIRKAV